MPRCLRVLGAALILTCITAGARAGGGESYSPGGGSSGGGWGGGGFDFGGGPSYGEGVDVVSALPFSPIWNAFIILAILAAVYFIKRRNDAAARAFRASLDPGLQSDLRRDGPEASPAAAALRAKLETLFVSVQKAWDGGDMGPVRAVISDGVYHRFQLQLEMNRRQGIRNRVEQPALLEARLLKEERAGKYLSADFLMRGSAVDGDVRIDTGMRVRGGGYSAFTEIWSFLRSVDAPAGEALRTLAACPKCAAPLTDAGGTRCAHCGAILNSGAWDWVLAEITQAVEWAGRGRPDLARYYARLPAGPGSPAEAWLSPQELEDRASVVFIRYQSALHERTLASLTAFAEPSLLAALGGEHRQQPLYRLAVGAVELRGFVASEGLVKAYVRIRFSGSVLPGQDVSHRESVMVFSRSLAAFTVPAGNAGQAAPAGRAGLSSLSCPACGGPMASTDQAACAYCGSALSGPLSAWTWCEYGGLSLLSRLDESPKPARAKGAAGPHAASAGTPPAGTQIRLFSAMVSAALEDRAITANEEATLRAFARHFGLGPVIVDIILRKAAADPDALRGAVDPAEAARWLNNFVLVAAMDGRIAPEEEAILAGFARKHGIEDKNLRYALKAALKTAAHKTTELKAAA